MQSNDTKVLFKSLIRYINSNKTQKLTFNYFFEIIEKTAIQYTMIVFIKHQMIKKDLYSKENKLDSIFAITALDKSGR